jgi:hypothetical protein
MNLTFHDVNGKELGMVHVRRTSEAAVRWEWNVPNGRLAAGTYVVRAVIEGRSISQLFTVE